MLSQLAAQCLEAGAKEEWFTYADDDHEHKEGDDEKTKPEMAKQKSSKKSLG